MCTRSSISPANMFALFIVRWLVETLFVCEFSKFVSISDNICRCLFFTWPVKMFVIWMRNILSAGTVEYPYHAFLVALPQLVRHRRITSAAIKCSATWKGKPSGRQHCWRKRFPCRDWRQASSHSTLVMDGRTASRSFGGIFTSSASCASTSSARVPSL